jgi:hypothetical protein
VNQTFHVPEHGMRAILFYIVYGILLVPMYIMYGITWLLSPMAPDSFEKLETE